MSRRLRPILGAWWLLAIVGTTPALGQANTPPVVSGIDPPGATVGQSVEWTISGRNLAQVKTLLVGGSGVEVVEVVALGENSIRAKVRIAPDAATGYREVRVDGPRGVSNLMMVRIDTLRQIIEAEPNDDPARPQDLTPGSAVVGVLKPLDLDHYRIKGPPGHRLTLDLEARRIGTSVSPVVTLLSASGVALSQGRESRGGDRDCRMTLVLPADGIGLVQVRDNTYGGSDQARYRLRIDPAPFATAIFPLGGPRGQAVEVEVSGGNLPEPRRKVVRLPDTPGAFVEVGTVDGPGGPVLSSGRLVVGDGPEVVEPVGRTGDSPIDVRSGVTVEGRIGVTGEVDAYRLEVKAGDRLRARVEAHAMGSWLDSVVSIRDDRGATIAENDDAGEAIRPAQGRGVNALGVPDGSPDSSVEFEAKADGFLTIEVSDRFGDGGPEYGYRLAIGPARPDFAVTLLLGNANANAVNNLGQARNVRTSPGQLGVFNLKPGGSTPINFLVSPEGRTGPVEVHAEGLPEGVTAEPVTIRLLGPRLPGVPPTGPDRPEPVADFLQLKVAPYAQPRLGEFRVVATAKLPTGVVLIREATATVGIDASGVGARPITRVIGRVPIRIIGENRPMFVGPPAPPTLKTVTVPGPLLIGDQIDLALDFDRAITPDDGSTVEAVARGVGLATNTVISAGTSVSDDEPPPDVTVHVLSSAKAQPGTYPVRVSYTPASGPTTVREVTLDVRAPIEVRPRAETIHLGPGDSATFQVEVRREAGFDGEVEMLVEGLPRGVKLARAVKIAAGATVADLVLEMAPTARLIAKPAEMQVVGKVRMPRGNLGFSSKIRPMIRPDPPRNDKNERGRREPDAHESGREAVNGRPSGRT